MALPGLLTHPKFRRLTRLLNAPVPHVLGYLECLYHVAYTLGDDRIGDALDVELAAQWPGEEGVLASALAETGFLDHNGEAGHYLVHDLWEHAPGYAHANRKRRQTRTCGFCGETYYSTQDHSKFCSLRCRVAHHRRGDSVTHVTDPSVTVTHYRSDPLDLNDLNEKDLVTEEGRTEGDFMLNKEDWEKHRAAACKLAKEGKGRVWEAHDQKKLSPGDVRLMLKLAFLAVASPARPYGLSWWHEGLDAVVARRGYGEPLKRPGNYFCKCLGGVAKKAGRDLQADLKAVDGLVPGEVGK